MHYARWKRHGDPMKKIEGPRNRLCSVDGCGRPHSGLGWCQKHWREYAPRPRCTIDDCTGALVSNGMCRRHLSAWQRHGDPRVRKLSRVRNTFPKPGVLIVSGSRGVDSATFFFDREASAAVRARKWRLDTHGYAVSRPWGHEGLATTTIYLHHVVMGTAPSPEVHTDHINGDIRDNTSLNLRIVSGSQNAANQAIVNGRGTSKYRGVYWAPNREAWIAAMTVNYRTIHLGSFTTEEAAASRVAAFRAENGLPSGY